MQQHPSVSGSHCVHTLFVSGDTLTIPIRATSAAAWYDTRDYYGITLAPDVADYLEICLSLFGHGHTVKQVRVLLCCPALMPQQESAVRNLVERYCALRTAQLFRSLLGLLGGAALLMLVCALFCALCITERGAASTLAAAVLSPVLGALFLCMAKALSVCRKCLLFAKMKHAHIEFKQEPAAGEML